MTTAEQVGQAEPAPRGPAGGRPRRGQHRGSADRIKRAAAVIWMNALIGAVIGVAAVCRGLPTALPSGSVPGPSWSTRAVAVFAIWVLSFVPGWLYVRFLGLRADALWTEYVLNLYRLGLDEPAALPPPPAESAYSCLPGASEGGSERHNIYRQKFNAYYGRTLAARPTDADDFRVSVDTLFPVFLCTATLAVAWSVILWNPVVLMAPSEPWAGLEFGVLGAYAFAVSMLVRRFYQSDLRSSAYASVVLRIVLVLLIVTVLHQLFAMQSAAGPIASAAQYVTAFVVGFFPLAGLQALQRLAAKVLRVVVRQMTPDYPLEQLDGLNIWYEARLAEEGVEDMQNLTTMNLVDVILHTRAPVGRLIDWLDQAFLLIHLDPCSPGRSDRTPGGNGTGDAATRSALRQLGVRSATELLRAFGPDVDPTRPARPAMSADALRRRGIDPDHIQTLVGLLAAEPGLDPVWNWKCGGAGRTTRPPTVGGASGATAGATAGRGPIVSPRPGRRSASPALRRASCSRSHSYGPTRPAPSTPPPRDGTGPVDRPG
jgi:hypothetical protein